MPERMTRPPACLVRNVRAATVRVRRAAAATKPATGEPSVAAARMACVSTRPDVERGEKGGSSLVRELGRLVTCHGVWERAARVWNTVGVVRLIGIAIVHLLESHWLTCHGV